jgi:DNA-binding IclR family transcriptional regulator
MLSQIIKEFRDSGGAVNLNELSRRLGVERSALDGMLETLVRKGRLREACTTGSSGCYHCGGSCHGCGQTHGNGLAGKSYELVSPNLRDEGAN